MENEIWSKNYLWRDYVTEDISVTCVGKVDLYFFKETLVGVRDNVDMTAFFVKIDSIPKTSSPYAPTLEKLTEDHIKDAVTELDTTGETLSYIDISDLMSKATEKLAAEISRLIDYQLTNGGVSAG